MRIAMFTNTYAPLVGGIEKSVATFAHDLRLRGHPALVVTPAFHDAKPDPHVFRIPALKRIGGTAFSLRMPFCSALTDHLKRFRPDVIHCHQPFMLGDTALRYARRFGVPLVFTHHTLYERYADQWAPKQESAYRLAVHLPTEFANLCDLVITPTPSVAQIIRGRGVTTPIAVAPTGIDTAFYAGGNGARARRRWGIPPEAKVIGHVGRLIPAKNLDHVAEAVGQALAEGPADARFLLVGEGDSIRAMRAIFQRFGVRNRTIRTGNLDGQDLADAYAAMDTFVFGSKTDTQGLVLVEAMSAGCPVVALDAPGPRDVVRDGVHGRLLPTDSSPDAMAEALLDTLADPDRLVRWSLAAAEHARSYSQSTCVDRVIEIYSQLAVLHRTDAALTAWDKTLERLNTEWSLLVEKSRIAVATVLGLSSDREADHSASAPGSAG